MLVVLCLLTRKNTAVCISVQKVAALQTITKFPSLAVYAASMGERTWIMAIQVYKLCQLCGLF